MGLRRGGVPLAGVFATQYALRLLVSVTAMAALLTLITPEVARWLEADLWWRVSHVSVLVVAGLGSFVVLLAAMGLRLREIKDPGLH